MVKASILGATGYTGQELARMLLMHSQVELIGMGSNTYAGKKYSSVYPHFESALDLKCSNMQDDALFEKADVIFLALPHGLSVPYAEKALALGKKVVDLGADFRLKSADIYQKWYKTEAARPKLLGKAVYGLPELYRDEIKGTDLVANPGCYPTTAILGLAPLLKNGLIDKKSIVIDSKSGVSGAGRSLKVGSLYSEANEDFQAYGFPCHRHAPEIEQELGNLAGEEIAVTFVPHLVPMTRGMLSTIYASLVKETDTRRLEDLYREFYQDEVFVRVLPGGRQPHTKWVLGTNNCDLGVNVDERTGRVTVVSVIDNLVKGASGQAIQNMNIMCGYKEEQGLNRVALYP